MSLPVENLLVKNISIQSQLVVTWEIDTEWVF